MKTLSWKIEGMRCSGCARLIEVRLLREPGIRHVEVSYAAGTVRLLVEPELEQLDRVVQLLEQGGYRITAATPR